ncbi:carboxypeptidase [Favolaschia claudopus]|uniref:Carboxypeptidase n=1 Tax=Favolaschia claudopus TaxID=2862362 RepID=A0AAW0CGQ7_9AGAR
MLPSLLLPLSLFAAVSCTTLHWKDYLVTNPLPNVTYPLPRNFAGSVPVNRDSHPNNTLFFWAFENTPGSLTAPQNSSQEPWIIWLKGGPGSSSFIGLMTENGPLRVTGDYSIVDNPYSWDKLADIVYVDQPVGVGYSTSDPGANAADENQVGEDFIGFLSNLVNIFPSLATRPLYLTGESYAGVYIPYITKAIFSTPHTPVKLKKIAIGDGAIGEYPTSGGITVLDIIATYPQLIGYDAEVFEYFQTQYQLCGYDFELTYPPTGPLPYLFDPIYEASPSDNLRRRSLDSGWSAIFSRSREVSISKREQEERRSAWKRDLSGRPNGTLDPYYGCFLLIELQDYASNYSFPFDLGGLNPYDVTSALHPPVPADASIFLNDPRTRAAIHAPSGKTWKKSVDLNWTGTATPNFQGDPSPLPITFLSELAANASKHDVGIVLYVGNDDLLVAHRGIEAVIQNFTFGGIQGFTRKPDTPFTDDHGRFSGIIHQERNVTYALFANAGHYVPESVPEAAFVFLREFILGSNLTGFVDSPTSPAVGGDDPELASNILPGNSAIFYGSGTTASSTVAPEATIAGWNSFIATATLSASATSA